MGDLLVIFLAWVWPALLAMSLAVWAIWWAIFADKARGRRRCPRCWHDLSRTPGLTCSECGHAADGEGDLARTRRRWGVAVAATAAAVAASVGTQLSILNATWPSYLPDLVLVRVPALAPLGELPVPIRRELGRRVASGQLGAESLLRLARTLSAHGPLGAAEDPGAELLGAVATSIPPELASEPGLPAAEARARAGALKDWHARLDATLESLPPWVEVTAPQQWPAGEDAVTYVRATVWGPRAEWRLRRRGGDGPWLVGSGIAGLRRVPLPAAVDAGAVGADGRLVADFDFEVRRGARGTPGWGPWTPSAPVRVDAAVPTLDPALLTETSGPELDEAIAAALSLPVTLWNDPERPVAFRLDFPRMTATRGPITVGMMVELCEGDIVRRRLRVSAASAHARQGWLLELEDALGLAGLRAVAEGGQASAPGGGVPLPGWWVRLRSDRRSALEAIGRSPCGAANPPAPCWSGTARMPAFGSPSPDVAPQRSYRLGFSDEIVGNTAKP